MSIARCEREIHLGRARPRYNVGVEGSSGYARAEVSFGRAVTPRNRETKGETRRRIERKKDARAEAIEILYYLRGGKIARALGISRPCERRVTGKVVFARRRGMRRR